MNHKKDHGKDFEEMVYKNLLKRFPKENIFRNIKFNYRNKETEIDILAVSGKKIYIFECKNLNNPVRGKLTDNYWYEYINYRWYRILNPFFQNRRHVDAVYNYLKSELNSSRFEIKSFVVMKQLKYISDLSSREFIYDPYEISRYNFKNEKDGIILDLLKEKAGIA